MLAPHARVGQRRRKRVLAEPPDIGALERVRLEGPAHRPHVEHERVEGHLGEAEPQAVEDHYQAHRFDVDACLLEDLFDRDLCRRVAHVGPTRRIEPGSGVSPLHEQDLALVVADDGPDRNLRCHVTGDALANVLHPLGDQVVSVA